MRQHDGTLRPRQLRVGTDIGIEIHGGDAVVLIRAGSRPPVAHGLTFTTVADGQRAVEIRLVHGGTGGIVGRFLLGGLRAAPRGEARIDVGVSLDPGGVLHAWASDRATGARQEAFFPGLWAIDAAGRAEALVALGRDVEAGLRGAATPLRAEALAALRTGDSGRGDSATALATIAGEMRILRKPRYDN